MQGIRSNNRLHRIVCIVASSVVFARSSPVAHTCGNGLDLVCIHVYRREGWPTRGGEGEIGHPHISIESGEEVYCLVDHDFHDCPNGETPCCTSGSQPSHRGGSGEIADMGMWIFIGAYFMCLVAFCSVGVYSWHLWKKKDRCH
jgi:hypothetical protein